MLCKYPDNIQIRKLNWKNVNNLNTIPTNSKELLGFNEPDNANQSNMSVTDIVTNWSNIYNTKLRIGSIATAQNVLSSTYFDSVWTNLQNNNMTPDFIAIHWYAPPNSINFLKLLDNIYAKYNKSAKIFSSLPS